MTNPVKNLIEALEQSIQENNYEHILIITNDDNILCSIDDISYVTRYFFKVKTEFGEVWVNINNLKTVELR